MGKKSLVLYSMVILAPAVLAGCSSKPVAPTVDKEARGVIVGGYVVHPDESREGQIKQQRAIARKQAEQLERQARERDDMERQEIYDARERGYLKGRAAAEAEPTVESDQLAPLDMPESNYEADPEPPPARRRRY